MNKYWIKYCDLWLEQTNMEKFGRNNIQFAFNDGKIVMITACISILLPRAGKDISVYSSYERRLIRKNIVIDSRLNEVTKHSTILQT